MADATAPFFILHSEDGMTKLSQDQIDRIIELYTEYGNGAIVAKEVGCSLYMVYKHLRTHGIEPKKNGEWQQKVDLQTITNLYQSGLSTTQIAKKLNLKPSSVWERLSNAGVEMRHRGEAIAQSRWGGKRTGSDKEVITLYKTGMNCADIAEHYGLSRSSKSEIAKVLHRNDIKPEIHGERSPHWKGGKLELNKMIRNCAHYINWRAEIFKERNYTCEITGERGGKLNVHHIKPLSELINDFLNIHGDDFDSQEARLRAVAEFKPFWDKSNVIVLTEDEHIKIHAK